VSNDILAAIQAGIFLYAALLASETPLHSSQSSEQAYSVGKALDAHSVSVAAVWSSPSREFMPIEVSVC
jgi:hypothetical protein